MTLIPEKYQKEITEELLRKGVFNNLFIQTKKENVMKLSNTVSGDYVFTWGISSNGMYLMKDTFVKPTHVVFNKKTTVLFWPDKTKTIVTCGENDTYDREHGVAMACVHKMFGSKNQFKKFVKNNSHTEVSKEDKLKRKEEQKNKKSAKLQNES